MDEREQAGLTAKTPVGEIQVTGRDTFLILGMLALAGLLLWQTSLLERQHGEILSAVHQLGSSVDEMMWSNLLTPEQKAALPDYIRLKAIRKVEESAEKKP